MTDFFTILDTEVEPNAPLISPLGFRWRDNPIAIAEGSVDAPINQAAWHPYNAVFSGDGNDGVIYDSAGDGSVADVVTPAFEDGYEYRVIGQGLSSSISGVFLDVYYYLNGAANYYRANHIGDDGTGSGTGVDSNSLNDIDHSILMPRAVSRVHFSDVRYFLSSADVGGGSGSLAGTNDGQVRAASDTVGGARYEFSGGNIDAGKLILLRRREFMA